MTDIIAARTKAAEAADAADAAHAAAILDLTESAPYKDLLVKLEKLYDPTSPDVGLDDAIRCVIQTMNDLPFKARLLAGDIARRRKLKEVK